LSLFHGIVELKSPSTSSSSIESYTKSLLFTFFHGWFDPTFVGKHLLSSLTASFFFVLDFSILARGYTLLEYSAFIPILELRSTFTLERGIVAAGLPPLIS